MVYVIGFGLTAGSLLPLQWILHAARRRFWVREMRWLTRRELGFWLGAEATASLLLFASSLGLVWRIQWAGPGYLLASGMMIHSLMRNLGDMGGQFRLPSMLLTVVLLLGALASILLLLLSAPPLIRY